ncbi:MAG: hypothetical protein HFI67_00765 [Lachnospiraceae bacterium]|jgi:hypothetical protein|nr:hypothetical protein [Lachnospiraceae bacterium]
MVLEFLETGNVFYVMLVVSVLGVLSKLLVNGRYRTLIKQSQNMGTAKDKYLKQWKLKFENTYRAGKGVGNIPVYVEKNFGQYRFMGIRLSRLSRFNSLAAAFVCLGGLTAAFMTYWYADSMKIVVLYAASGVLLGGAMALWEELCNTKGKRGRLLLYIRDYFENTLVGRLEIGQTAALAPEGGGMEGAFVESTMLDTEEEADQIFTKEDIANAFSEVDALIGRRYSEGTGAATFQAEKTDELRRLEEAAGREQDAQLLRNSLERIAAGRKGNGRGRKLTEEEERLIEDIIQEYLYE